MTSPFSDSVVVVPSMSVCLSICLSVCKFSLSVHEAHWPIYSCSYSCVVLGCDSPRSLTIFVIILSSPYAGPCSILLVCLLAVLMNLLSVNLSLSLVIICVSCSVGSRDLCYPSLHVRCLCVCASVRVFVNMSLSVVVYYLSVSRALSEAEISAIHLYMLGVESVHIFCQQMALISSLTPSHDSHTHTHTESAMCW